MNGSKTLLIIENEPAIVRFLRSSLGSTGWQCLEARTVQTGLRLASEQALDVILVDLAMPHGGALEVLKSLRQWTSTPILLMGSRGQEDNQVACLEAGADDFLMKPFTPQELIARLQLALRHAEQRFREVLPVYECRGLRMDLTARRVWFLNEEIHLSPMQYEFLTILVRNAGRVVNHRELIDRVWGEGREVSPDVRRTFVYSLRKKIEADPSRPQCLKTEPGVGYRLESPDLAANKLLMAQQ